MTALVLLVLLLLFITAALLAYAGPYNKQASSGRARDRPNARIPRLWWPRVEPPVPRRAVTRVAQPI